jgi:hypothetical protein
MENAGSLEWSSQPVWKVWYMSTEVRETGPVLINVSLFGVKDSERLIS